MLFRWVVILTGMLLTATVGAVNTATYIPPGAYQYIDTVKQESNKEKEIQEAKINFFTIIAHEIRTPVSLIIGPLEKIMQSTRELPEQIFDNLKIIDRNSQRLLNLINQLLDFRKVEQEDLKLNFTKENINDIIKSVSERFIPYLIRTILR